MESSIIVLGVVIVGFIAVTVMMQVLGRNLPQN
jgi:hypothetical protein